MNYAISLRARPTGYAEHRSGRYRRRSRLALSPEPKPEEPGLFQFLVGLEGILGPLQIALLALAIRRKVMR